MSAGEFGWSAGHSRFDVHPRQHAGSLRDLARYCAAHRSAEKGRDYLCAPLGGDGRRCRDNVLPRNWLALDVDHIDPDVHTDWRLHLAMWQAVGWSTHSSTPEAPRERVLVALDEAVDDQQAQAIGALLRDDLAMKFGAAIVVDASTFRGSQPCYLPAPGVQLFFGTGDLLDTAEWLAQAPPAPAVPQPLDELAAAQAGEALAWLLRALAREGHLISPLANDRGYSLHCPWAELHTTARQAGEACLFFPSEANGWRGAYRCLHSHCAGRRLGDLLRLTRMLEQRRTVHESET